MFEIRTLTRDVNRAFTITNLANTSYSYQAYTNMTTSMSTSRFRFSTLNSLISQSRDLLDKLQVVSHRQSMLLCYLLPISYIVSTTIKHEK